MVESGLFPIVRDMAFSAVRPKLAGVMVVFGMACVAILRCAFEDIIGVAGRTVHGCMPAQQLERSLVMIESRLFPIIWDMAFTAILPKPAVMGVIFGMAGRAILGSGLQVSDIFSALMAASAQDRSVLALELEGQLVMVKSMTIRVHPVVAGPAILAEGLDMGLDEGRVDLAMAGNTGLLIEMGEISAMAVRAGESRTISLLLMGLERETDLIVRKILE